MAGAEWRNWAGNVVAHPVRVEKPGTIAEVQDAVRRAVADGLSVRVAGAGHSFSPICETDGVLLDLVNLTGVVAVDEDRAQATILGGTRIHQIGAPLFEHGLAVANQGDIDVQAIAGALGTGTHGTGKAFGSFSSTLVRAQIVTATGDLVTVDDADIAILRAARVSLGMLGVMVTATLQLVPAYKLKRRSWAVAMDAVESSWRIADEETRNPEFWWIPPLDTCVFKTFVETDEAPTGTPPAAATYPPGTIERYLPADGVDWAWRVFPAVREHRFVEMEYTVAVDRGIEAFQAIRALMADHPEVRWAVEYRTHAAEDAFLSATQGVDSVTISVHDAVENPHWDFFRAAERVFRSFEGRPHWGKLNFLEPEELRSCFMGMAEFDRVRRSIDPNRVFLNAYLRERFG